MKVTLVYPPADEVNLKGYPLGLAYLSASLKKRHQVNVLNYCGKPLATSVNFFLKDLSLQRPDVVGISFNSFNRWGAYCLIRKIKKILKNCKVALGGVHPSSMYVQLFEHFGDMVDFIIQSEGERSFYELCNALEEKSDFTKISGLAYKDKQDKIIANSVEVIADLDSLPMPDYSYAQDEIRQNETAYLITSRGCPVNCVFCSTSSFWGQNVRMNSPERVLQEVQYAMSMGARRIFFHDDTFNLGIDRTLKLAKLLKKENIEYVVQCRVKPVSEEMIEALVDSGCRHITWGAESLSKEILDKTNKKICREEVKRAFDICVKYSDRLTTGAYFCVGMPGESEETIRESIDYLNENIRSTHGPGASMLYILPGTQIYRDLIAQKKFDEKIWIRTPDVKYYTHEHDIWTLNRWRKMINRSGIHIPFKGQYIIDLLTTAKDFKEKSIIRRKLKKIGKKIRRFINMAKRRY
ncbi:MAG: radical SAM protein [Candidatus Omnitrophota bacterium]|jgi:radical SAM superfamily enzyme YgiQ (UPF0313 family)